MMEKEKDRKKIVVVDDDETYLTIARKVLMDRHDVFTVVSAKKLFRFLEKVKPDLILLDIEMPEIGGYEVIRILKASEDTAQIPVIFLTARSDAESELTGLQLGAVDYIAKPFSQELLLKRIELHLLFESQRQALKSYSCDLEGTVLEKTRSVFKLQNAILTIMAGLVEHRDSDTGGHIERTQYYLRMLVRLLLEHGIYVKELSSWDTNLLLMSSQLHDIGKISIRDCILLKPSELTDEEFEEMKKHAAIGRSIIEKIERSTEECAFLEHAKIMAATHHEKWDGTGYPAGLKGEEIPLQGRLMALIDVYDALTNDRPYKKAYTHKEALAIIKKGLGTHFDPLVGDILVKYEHEFENYIKGRAG